MPPILNTYYRTSIKALVLDSDRRFLLTKDKIGKWDLPGGGLDWGEDPRHCITREIQEEMGIETTYVADQPSYFIAAVSDSAAEKWITNVVYIAKLQHLNFTLSDECVELGFFSIEEARELDLFSNVEQFTRMYNPQNHGEK